MKHRSAFKIIIHIMIVAAWLGVMFVLIEKEGLIRINTGKTEFRDIIPKDMELDIWKGVYLNDQWIGYVHTTFGRDTLSESKGYYVHSFSFLRFKMFNQIQGLAIKALQELDSEFRMIRFAVRISGVTDIFFKGKRLGDKVYLDIHLNRNKFTRVFDVGDDLFLEQSILSIYRGKGLKVGDAYRVSILNPLTIKTEDVTVEVVKKDGDNLILETRLAGLASRTWVDANGVVIREETSNGWVMKRESEDSIDQHLAQSQSSPVDILRETSVRAEGELQNPRQVKSLTIKVWGIDTNTLLPDGIRQKFIDQKEGILEIVSLKPDPEKRFTIPYDGKRLARFLQSTPWINWEDPRIKAKAAEIVGDERDGWRAAQKISTWVYKNVAKTFNPGIPVATSVLQDRRGDCNEHTVLFVALARAAGIPAEMCAGLVYLRDGFYYHSWPKVFVGTWVHLDPTFGQPVADATHFEIISGDFNAQARIATMIGKIQIRILKTSVGEHAETVAAGTAGNGRPNM